jgi:glycosyltransferase involved in cell wall biosynthesis
MALPVVVPNHSGLSAFCHEDTSYLVPVDESQRDRAGFPRISVEAFAEALKNVVNDARSTGRAQAIGRAARQRMKESWSPEKVVFLIAQRVADLSKDRLWK